MEALVVKVKSNSVFVMQVVFLMYTSNMLTRWPASDLVCDVGDSPGVRLCLDASWRHKSESG